MYAFSVSRKLSYGMTLMDELYDKGLTLPSSDDCALFLKQCLLDARSSTAPRDASGRGMLALLAQCCRVVGHAKGITPSVGTKRGRQCGIACTICDQCTAKVISEGEEVPIAAHGCQVPLLQAADLNAAARQGTPICTWRQTTAYRTWTSHTRCTSLAWWCG